METEDALLKKIKAHLRITYDHLNESVTEMIDEGIADIESMCGPTDFSKPGLALSLLKDYCRYTWSNVPELFEVNCHKKILRLQLMNGVQYAKKEK